MRSSRIFAALACLTLATALSGATAAAAVPAAKLINERRAVAPPSAPPAVKKMIAAANHIRNRPYKWGGGHRSWNSKGYDCSGAVSYVLHAAGALNYPLDSTGFMRYGRAGRGAWVTIYTNPEHAYMVIAGLRFDTSYITDGDRTGPGWSEYDRPSEGFRVRHPVGLLR